LKISFREELYPPLPRKEIRYNTVTSTHDRGYAIGGYSATTQQCYVAVVRRLAQHYHRSPDQLSEEQLRQYFLYLVQVKKVAPSTLTIALSAIKLFYERTPGREWKTLRLVRPARQKKLPVVLSRQEVRRILACVEVSIYRACLKTLYSCGLRLSEGLGLQVADVDGDRLLLHIRGKGNQDRYVPLPEFTLQILRMHWCTYRCPQWLFPARKRRQGPSAEVPCKRPSTAPSNRAGSPKEPTCTRCAIPTPLICWKPASTSGSFKRLWATGVLGPPRSTPI